LQVLFLGIDVGSSSVKLSLVDGDTGKRIAAAQYPDVELAIDSRAAGWAEQHPQVWWDSFVNGSRRLFANVDAKRVRGIGISYQMHGLVVVDRQLRAVRPAIIWCDSRAVECGEATLSELGPDYCFQHLLNAPGNFTGAKLRWVQCHEPDTFARIHKAMLPGDYIAMRLSGEVSTTPSGLSEGTLWDFETRSVANWLLQHWQIDLSLVPEVAPGVGVQCEVSKAAAAELGLSAGTPIAYRFGDQPNNAFSLKVLDPGEVATTAGTSGVIYGVTDQRALDRESRVNTFIHVTDTVEAPRNGVLMCVNGTGRAYSWLRQLLANGTDPRGGDYEQMNRLAASVPVGSDGLICHPFGNGAERIFQNRTPGAQFLQLDLNRHGLGHVARATQEGIVFALNRGFDILKSLIGECRIVRAGNGNMFRSAVFTEAFANTTGAVLELFETDGADGAARGAALGIGHFASPAEALSGLERLAVVEPTPHLAERYGTAYRRWSERLPV
jgi:xylulokinase